MSRLNPKRRLLAKVAALRISMHEAKITQAKAMNPQMVATEGPMRDTSSKLRLLCAEHVKAPREPSWEGAGKLGKVVKGEFKPKSYAKTRFGKS